MPTPTRTEPAAAARTRVAVELDSRGRVRVESDCAGAPVLRPMLLSSDHRQARVFLVSDGAMLLAGDRIELTIDVGPGVHLEIGEAAGLVAYAMRGGMASYDAKVVVREDARLTWHGEPFVVAEGATVRRALAIGLEPGSRLALRDSVLLGRHQEGLGSLDHNLTVTEADGRPVLVEHLALGRASASWGSLGEHRALGSVLALGFDIPRDQWTDHRYDLERSGTLWRHLAPQAHLLDLAAVWRDVVQSGG